MITIVFLVTSCSCFQTVNNPQDLPGPTIFAQSTETRPLPKPLGPNSTDKPKSKASKAAEALLNLKKSIEEDEKTLAAIKAKLDDPNNEYRKAEMHFGELDANLKAKQKEIDNLKKEGKTKEAVLIEAGLLPLQERWTTAKKELDLAINEWKTVCQKADNLKKGISHDRKELDAMIGVAVTQTPKKEAAAPHKEEEPKKSENATTPSILPGINLPAPQPGAVQKTEDKELTKAQKVAEKKEVEAKKANDKQLSIGQQLENFQTKIDLERKLLEATRKKADLAMESFSSLTKQISKLHAAKAPVAKINELEQKLTDAQASLDTAQDKVHILLDNLERLQKQRNTLLTAQLVAAQEAQKKQRELNDAKKVVAELSNPFTVRNLQQWFLNHGVNVLAILLGVVILNRLVKFSSQRVVKAMAERSEKRKSKEERKDRAETLIGVFRNGFNTAIIIGGLLMLLDEVGVSIVPLMGGAAILGLAVAFASQNLLRDYFTGFNILLEDQYGVKDVVKIGEIAGMVEKITMRVTTLRDLDGILHFFPHGSITTVSNMTHGWGRARFDIGVAYKEDVDRVMEVLKELAAQLRLDEVFGPLIIEDAEMLGVDAFSDSAVVIRFLIKTRPLQQWKIKREMLRRIKKKFDELGIQIPFPHRTVYHHFDSDAHADSPENFVRNSSQAA